jgi:hypothetical protein
MNNNHGSLNHGEASRVSGFHVPGGSTHWRRLLATGLGVILPMVIMAPLSGAPTISGTVRNANTNLGMAGFDLDVFDAAGNAVTVTGARSGTNGVYTITLPSPGTFVVRVDAKLTDGFADQFYNQKFLRSAANTISLPGSNSTASNINFSLGNGFEIAGKVTANGTGVDGIDIDVFAANGEFLDGYPATTANGGFYTVGTLPPGDYYIRADSNPTLGQYYQDTFYGGTRTITGAVATTLSGSSRTGRDISIPLGGIITGTVRDQSTNQPIAGIDMDLFDTLGSRSFANAVTDASGVYTLGALPAGTYTLRADPSVAQGYARRYYTNGVSQATATTFVVNNGATTSNINFALPRSGSISGFIRRQGTLQPLAGIDLDCYLTTGERVDLTTVSAADGSYTIGPLAPGSYKLRADPTQTQGSVLQYYSLKPDEATSDNILVSAENVTSGINFELGAAGWIQGTVRRQGDNAVLPDIDLDLYDAATDLRVSLNAVTDAAGAYLLGPVPVGQYKLRCDPTVVQGYAVEYYNSKPRRVEADAIAVTEGAGATGINFLLDQGGSISGSVKRVGFLTPLQAVDVDVFSASTQVRYDQSAKSAADGSFTVGPLPVGSYLLRADVPQFLPYLDQYYNGKTSLQNADPIVLNAGASVTGIQFLLESDGSVGEGWMLY